MGHQIIRLPRMSSCLRPAWTRFVQSPSAPTPALTFCSFQRFSPLNQVFWTWFWGWGFCKSGPCQLGMMVCSSTKGKSRGKSKQVWTHEEQMERREWSGNGEARLGGVLSFILVVYDRVTGGDVSRGLIGITSMLPTFAECLLCARPCAKGFLYTKLLPSQQALDSSVIPRREWLWVKSEAMNGLSFSNLIRATYMTKDYS